MTLRSIDQFDDFRKERKRMRAKLGPQAGALGYDNKALRELEEVEAREVLEQRLTREVHEFFATATRQAAGIVERVAREAQAATGERVEQEMEAFLIDALARMNTFVVTALQQKRTPVAEAQMEPRIARIVGQPLDDFRFEGTAETGNKHIGEDPFDTDVEDVRREFRSQVGPAKTEKDDSVPIEQHLVAAVTDEPEKTDEPQQDDDESPAAPATPAATARPAAADHGAGGPSPGGDLDRFKAALASLVRQGTMTKDEARAAWQARVQATKKG